MNSMKPLDRLSVDSAANLPLAWRVNTPPWSARKAQLRDRGAGSERVAIELGADIAADGHEQLGTPLPVGRLPDTRLHQGCGCELRRDRAQEAVFVEPRVAGVPLRRMTRRSWPDARDRDAGAIRAVVAPRPRNGRATRCPHLLDHTPIGAHASDEDLQPLVVTDECRRRVARLT